MKLLDRIACALAERAPEQGLRRRLLAAHRLGCARCMERETAQLRVEAALRTLAGPAPVLPLHLRLRVSDAVEREVRARGKSGRPRRALLARATLATGALAVASLVVAVFASRIESWTVPPRTVRIVLPAGTHALDEPVILVRRASGREERR